MKAWKSASKPIEPLSPSFPSTKPIEPLSPSFPSPASAQELSPEFSRGKIVDVPPLQSMLEEHTVARQILVSPKLSKPSCNSLLSPSSLTLSPSLLRFLALSFRCSRVFTFTSVFEEQEFVTANPEPAKPTELILERILFLPLSFSLLFFFFFFLWSFFFSTIHINFRTHQTCNSCSNYGTNPTCARSTQDTNRTCAPYSLSYPSLYSPSQYSPPRTRGTERKRTRKTKRGHSRRSTTCR
jgi:hypothetical protein